MNLSKDKCLRQFLVSLLRSVLSVSRYNYRMASSFPSRLDWFEMTEDQLLLAAFEEGVPPSEDQTETKEVEGVEETIEVSMSSEIMEMPFGRVKTEPFLELFWRKTGADCVDEEEEMKFPNGITYKIRLCE